MITAENTITEMTATEIAARRDMEIKIFILWQNYLAASNLYMAMFGKPDLFDENRTDAQYETCRDLEDSHNALATEYARLYINDGTEAE